MKSVLASVGITLIFAVGCQGQMPPMPGTTPPAEIPAADPAGPKQRIAIINVGGVDAAIMEHCVTNLQAVFLTPLTVLPPQEAVGADSLEDELPPLEKLKAEDTFCILAVIMGGEGNEKYVATYPKRRIAFVNARTLKPADGDETLYERRMKSETVRMVAYQMGIAPAPDPRCASHAYLNDDGLNQKGTNLCPPYQADVFKIGARLNLQGHPIDREQYYRKLAEEWMEKNQEQLQQQKKKR
jgi:hypothetical protein